MSIELGKRVSIDPEIKDFVARFDEAMYEPGLDIQELRRRYSTLLLEQGAAPNPVPTRELEIPTRHGKISARLYRPESQSPLPLLVYLHGGGFMVGDLASLDTPLHQLSREAGIAILSLDYALSPEHLYPVALEQCEDALKWAATHCEDLGVGSRLGIAGDSSGGNLTALLALRARGAGGPPLVWQAMINPVLDFPGVAAQATESHKIYAQGPILKHELMMFFMQCYFPTDAAKVEASPLHRTALQGLPPAFVAAAQCDPLRDEGLIYGERLARAGCPVVSHLYPGLPHNFITMSHLSGVVRGFLGDLAAAARAALHGDAR